jgi:hypothetical protein
VSNVFCVHAEFGAARIEQQVAAIEGAVASNPGLVFDLAKTLVESVCKTILSERKVPFDSNYDLPKLFKTIVTNPALLLVSASSEAEARKPGADPERSFIRLFRACAGCGIPMASRPTGRRPEAGHGERPGPAGGISGRRSSVPSPSPLAGAGDDSRCAAGVR